MKLKTPQLPRKGHHVKAAPAPMGASTPMAPAGSVGTTVAASPLRKTAGGLASPVRKRNTAAMIVGLAFVLVAAAMAASVASSFDDSINVLVAAEPIVEGQPVTADNFRTVKIAAGSGDIQAVSPESIPDLIGLIAAGPIGEGSLVHPDQFAETLENERIVIGALLTPNQYPASGLKPGDRVRLISIAARSSDEDRFSSGQEVAVGEIIFVHEVRDGLQVSIRVGESSANVVAQLIAQKRISIGLVDQSVSIDNVTPLRPADPVVPQTLPEEPAQ